MASTCERRILAHNPEDLPYETPSFAIRIFGELIWFEERWDGERFVPSEDWINYHVALRSLDRELSEEQP